MRLETVRIRRAASSIRSCADSVSQVTGDNLRPLLKRMSAEFEGKAADALIDKVSALNRDLDRLADGLETLSAALYAYARRVEKADEASRHIIRS